MFVLSFPDEKIQKILEVNDNLKNLKKAITQITKPFETYPKADFFVYSVLNNNETQAKRSFIKLENLRNILVVAEFPTNTKGLSIRDYQDKKSGAVFLFVNNKAKLESFSYDIPLIGRRPYEACEGTWDEIISEYLKFIKCRLNI